MIIKYIAWKKVICSDVNRLVYGINGPGISNKGDQAIQNFNTLNENPGLWSGFTNGLKVPRKIEVEALNKANGTHNPTTFDVLLKNSVNPLKLWEDKNDTRHNPVKINSEIWDRTGKHASAIIETWYLGYMRILEQLLKKIVARDGITSNANKLLEFVSYRLSLNALIHSNLLQWIYETQDGFNSMTLDTSFLSNSNLNNIQKFVEDYFYLVVKCEDEGETYNMALMANSKSPNLHPTIKSLLSDEKGGKSLNLDVAKAATSPDAQRFLEALLEKKNIILYGPPGIGKTHLLMEIKNSFNSDNQFDDLNTEAPFMVTNSKTNGTVEWCTFHPNYTYESFVYGFEPYINEKKLAFKPHVGPFLKQSISSNNGIQSLLIIDEINRANTDDVFGNTLSIIGNDSVEEIPFTHPISINGMDISSIKKSDNLYILGTMNSLDKSTSPLSYELKNRFTIIEMFPSVDVLRGKLNFNTNMPEELKTFICELMSGLNHKIHDYVGKEFELGQGYFWPLVGSTNNFVAVLGDILRNKIIPHLKDILSVNDYADFFGSKVVGELYYPTDYGFDLVECSQYSNEHLINLFAKVIDSSLELAESSASNSFSTLNELDDNAVLELKDKLLSYKNVIISGVSGVGKSFLVSKLLSDPDFVDKRIMYWHSSTQYADVIEGISAIANDAGEVEYSVLPGIVKQLADSKIPGKKLMVIEGVNKSNTAENFGELITLLEPDKRKLKIRGYNDYIEIPEDMYFLCTMNPSNGNFKLDSALKRRFLILNIEPNYEALKLHLSLSDLSAPLNIDNLELFNENEIGWLSIELLKHMNQKISECLGAECRLSHNAFWSLDTSKGLQSLCNEFDTKILPHLAEFYLDDEMIVKMFGEDSTLIKKYNHGIEFINLSTISVEDLKKALKGMLR